MGILLTGHNQNENIWLIYLFHLIDWFINISAYIASDISTSLLAPSNGDRITTICMYVRIVNNTHIFFSKNLNSVFYVEIVTTFIHNVDALQIISGLYLKIKRTVMSPFWNWPVIELGHQDSQIWKAVSKALKIFICLKWKYNK